MPLYPYDSSSAGVTATSGTVSRTLADRFSEVVNVKDFGALGDDDDDTDAVLLAVSAAQSRGLPLYFPPGTYNLATIDSSINIWDGFAIRGAGPSSIIKWNDTAAGGGPTILFYRAPNLAQINDVAFTDITIRGSQDTNPVGAGPYYYPVLLYSIKTVRFERFRSSWARAIGMATRGVCEYVSVVDCVVEGAARDGISVAGCIKYNIVGNRVSNCDDDSIAAHAMASTVGAGVDFGGVISGNYIYNGQGIKALGATSVAITGNTLDFTYGFGIDVSTDDAGGEVDGNNAAQGIVITGNVIRNHMSRSGIDGLSTASDYIQVNGISARAGLGNAIPGWNHAATGTIVDPYAVALNNSTSADVAIMPSGGITISGNTLQRTVGPTTNFSDYGYGPMYIRSGEIDPEITADMFQGAGIRIDGGHVQNTNITGNVIQGMGRGVYITTIATPSGFKIGHNTFYDLALGGIIASASIVAETSNYVEANVFDGDPYHKDANRGADGSWAAINNLTALLFQGMGGWVISRNVFRNWSRISDASLTTDANITFTGDNVAEGEPVAVGFSTSNLGIGDVPNGSTILWRVVDADPNSANFRKVLNNCVVASSAMPSSGTYVTGHFVRNTAPTATAPFGWSRLTIGSGHTLNTDWKEVGGRLLTPMVSELTIASGAVTVTGVYHRVDTESDAASDDLDTINGGVNGALLVLRAENSGRTVVVKDGTGNIQCAGDCTLDNVQDTITLIYDSTQSAWLEISRSDSGA